MISAAFLVLLMGAILMAPHVAKADESAAWQALRGGEAVLMLRHALAPGTGDPASFDLDDCSTQRNLNDIGREQARAWKPLLASHAIDQARVFSSHWCRCMDTATEMDMGEVTAWPSLNSFFRNRGKGPKQTQQTIDRINNLPPGKTVILVSHQVNVTALAGVFPASNEGVIIGLPLSENPAVLARVAPGR
jgi:phosphohistidine phosphatase SixA